MYAPCKFMIIIEGKNTEVGFPGGSFFDSCIFHYG